MTPYRIEQAPGTEQLLAASAREMVQATFVVTPNQYAAFAAAIAGGGDPPSASTLVVRENVFQPRRTRPLLAKGSPETLFPTDTTIAVDGPHAEALLAAALADGIEFWFSPAAGTFLVYADRDDYATVFAMREAAVARVAERLRAAGFTEVPSYRRKL
jgi:hypothetical protein